MILAVLVLAVEGYFGYRWYERYYGDSASGPVSSAQSGATSGSKPTLEPGGAPSEDRSGGTTTLVHRATVENIVDNSTYVDNPAANGNPDAVILVTQVWQPDGTAVNAHPTGVWYDENRGGRWAIFNQDLEPMPNNAVFNVVISEKPGEDVFVHRATTDNTDGESSYVDHPMANAAPNAVLSITPNWNPGGGAGVYENHPVGVWYDADLERWAVRNGDLAAMSDGAAFSISVMGGNQG